MLFHYPLNSSGSEVHSRMTKPRFLESLPATFFDPRDTPTTVLDIRGRLVTVLPPRDDLVSSVTTIRVVRCQLASFLPTISDFVNLTLLNLSDNALQTIPLNSFSPLVRLDTLDLSFNHLTSLSCNFPPSLTTLHVSFNPGIDIRGFWQKSIPNLKILRLANCAIPELPADLPPWANSLHAFQLDGNDFQTVPEVLARFPVLDELSLFANKISGLNGVRLPQKLKLLNLAFNDLQDCQPEETFATHTLDISSNFLREVPVRLLTDVNLRSITVSRSGISGAVDFELPPNVSVLDFSYNQITVLSERFIRSIAKLHTLKIGSNQIREIPDCFPDPLNLLKFYCDENLLESLPSSLLRARHLEILSCASCRFKQLPEFTLPQLESLSLQFNQLASLPDCFGTAPQLNALNVSFNKLSELPRSLGTCRNVTIFYGAGNLFLKFPRPILSFAKLKTLVMTGNKLTSIPGDLSTFFYLTTIDFANNNLQSYPAHLSILRPLKIFSLSHNAIQRIGAQGFPPNLTIADFSFNLLEEIPPGLQQSACVCLDFNPITKIDPGDFKGLHFLSTNGCRIGARLIDQLPTFMHDSTVRFIEAIGNEESPIEIPPLSLHILDSSTCSFPRRFGVGYAATLGRRESMEDCVTLKNYNDSDFLCGVFDGHGGSFAAATAAHCVQEEVRIRLIEAASDGLGMEKVLVGCLTAVNNQLRIVDAPDGCTGAIAFIHGDRVYTASVGDSRIIRVQKSKCERLTVDAKPTLRSEYVRLRQAGLVINTDGRIRGKLSVSRAFGDFACGDGLYVEPDVGSFVIEEEDDALVVACDGLWDMLSDEVTADIVRTSVTAVDAAVTLKNYAFALGSIDNISVIVVKFHPDEGSAGFCTRNTVELLPLVEVEEEELPPVPTRPQRRARR